jgi:glycosyltransferase involved in cell wall biosynthesis
MGDSEKSGDPVRSRIVISSFDNTENPYYNGGGAAVVAGMAARLASEFDVTVVTAGARGGVTERDGVRYQNLPLAWAGPRGGQLLYHFMLPLAARRFPHDLWIESFTPPFSTSFIPVFSRSRVVGIAQSLSGREMSARYGLPFLRIERIGLRFYRDVILLNPADLAEVRTCNPTASLHLMPLGIKVPDLDERLLGGGEHILFIGRIDIAKKGLDLLLDAYRRSGVATPLVIAGAGTPIEERRLTALLADTGSSVRWAGYVTGRQKQELLERSAFVVMPSRFETFGLSALEGMSHGKPVIHFDLPTLSWTGGSVRVPAFEVTALAAEMRNLAENGEARRKLGYAAHAAALRYGDDETSNRYLALVRELLDCEP